MATFVSTLEPTPVWKHFDRILSIPRGSKNEEGMRAFVREVAARNELRLDSDTAGNLVVRKPASAGRESAPAVVLQSHLDMVSEKNSEVVFDFTRDAIQPRQVGDYLHATGTTLGADNGIGVAAMLALAEASASNELAHGPLELLFTVDEETGLTGAAKLDPSIVAGRRLLNLDTEEEYALYVGCAGGAGTNLTIPLDTMFGADGLDVVEVKLIGFKGGHSGVDIHLQRGNAISLLARALQALWPEYGFELVRIEGGNMHNAIPREATALVRVAHADKARFTMALGAQAATFARELAGIEEGVRVEVAPAAAPAEVLSEAATRRVLALLAALPHGVLAMSHDIPGLVETSTNLAKVRTDGAALRIHQSNRSSVMSVLRATQQRIGAFAELAGGEATQSEGYPGWQPNLASPLLAAMKQVHQETFGRAAEIKAIHAGLECGLIGEKFPGMDMISFGPQIEFPHSPDERVLIPSVARFWQLLGNALRALAA